MSARHWSDGWTRDNLIDEIERLRALLAQYQVANYAPEDSDLYEETRRALEGK